MSHKTITLDPADTELRAILGTVCLRTGPIAHILRKLGHDIECRAEAEQGYVILWMLQFYRDHGAGWRVPAQAELDKARTRIEPADGNHATTPPTTPP